MRPLGSRLNEHNGFGADDFCVLQSLSQAPTAGSYFSILKFIQSVMLESISLILSQIWVFGLQSRGNCQKNHPAGREGRSPLRFSPTSCSSSSPSHPAPKSTVPSALCLSYVWFHCLPPLSRVFWILKRNRLAATLQGHRGTSAQVTDFCKFLVILKQLTYIFKGFSFH